ncbi:phosphate/phosphite/phosphonate ABC transporter substrate-binding protein [Microbacterium marinilacus]|uniref:Phosphate/phosphite/phosphonate ABC transporter substrate-binding protein n=1 Tax=Microbacterium marinilacus TaxID=415209 RepID=A0ABP7B963_9MICO|nr:phosphate/phosphite/phosphonate ABC transporter substrate-binding protein [Microbacterium marinilacus]MBY0687333.1 phosphate/phosphite/phosphonate ABC transporter substrate-binding protein [Microbacterium marinilacus]
MKLRTPAALLAATATALVLAGCGGGPSTGTSTEPADGEDPTELVLGLVPSQDVDQLVLDAEELGTLLEEELGVPVETSVSSDYTALVTAMQAGQADIGMFGPIALVQAADQAGAVPVLQSVRYGSSTYVTQWYTADTDRFCLDEVVTDEEGYTFCNGTDSAENGPVGEDALASITADETIAFVDEGSASGYYYPATQLQQVAGIDPLDLTNAFFAGGHPNAVLAVESGDATVGVSFNDARTEVVEEIPTIGEDLTVFAWSTDIPNDGVAVSGDLSEEWQQRIADAFLAVADTDDGVAVLQAVYNIDGLVPADLDALDAARQVAANFGDE